MHPVHPRDGPCGGPLTIHPTAIGRYVGAPRDHDAALLDFDMLQTPHGQREAVPITVKPCASRTRSRPCR